MPEYREYNFFTDDAVCMKDEVSIVASCAENKTAKDNYYIAKSELDTNKEKYENIEYLYGKEIVDTVNISLGISLLILYIYYTK